MNNEIAVLIAKLRIGNSIKLLLGADVDAMLSMSAPNMTVSPVPAN